MLLILMNTMKKNYKIALIGLGLLFIVGAGFTYDKYFEIAKNIEIFANVYKEINANYVDETDPSKLMKAGIDAMLNTLDPFTNYISEVQIENYRLAIEGKYNGIGARAKKIGDYVTITEVYKDYPAFKAGLQIGDQVLAVNGLDAKGKDSEDLYQIMRGMPKSEVQVTIMRPGSKEKLNLKLVRDEVNIPNVPYSGMVNENIGYIILNTFTENAGKNVQDAFKKLKAENPGLKGIIFDLRENGGGLLHEAVNVCNTFLPQGQLIASTRSKIRETDQSYKTNSNAVDELIPLVILINKNSASASEIVSGTMQDLDRGVLIGQISYGKGLVQNTKDVGYNAKVKLTISKYYIPSGRCIQSSKYENGVKVHLPDSLRSAFKTRNGRVVYDGGGVDPDIEMKEADHPEIVQKILDQNMLFNYCTDYSLKNPPPADPKTYRFNEVEDFINYLKKNQFDDLSPLEMKLKELETEAQKSKTKELDQEIAAIKKDLNEKQWLDIEEHKELLRNLIEEELTGRVFYEGGRLLCRLQHDPLVKEAISVLNNTNRYQSILKGSKSK